MNWTSISGLDGDKNSYGYYVTKGCDSHHIRLTNKYSPNYARGFEHLYNTFEVSIEVFPKVDVIHHTCDDDNYSSKLNQLLKIVTLYSAFHYKFTFNYFQLQHILHKYHMHYSVRHSNIHSHFYTDRSLATGYDIRSNKTNNVLCTLDGIVGYKVNSYLERKVVNISYYNVLATIRKMLSHITPMKPVRYKTIKVKYKIPKPLAHVCQLWSGDMRAMIFYNKPQLLL